MRRIENLELWLKILLAFLEEGKLIEANSIVRHLLEGVKSE